VGLVGDEVKAGIGRVTRIVIARMVTVAERVTMVERVAALAQGGVDQGGDVGGTSEVCWLWRV
jgi:hypothetical protein